MPKRNQIRVFRGPAGYPPKIFEGPDPRSGNERRQLPDKRLFDFRLVNESKDIGRSIQQEDFAAFQKRITQIPAEKMASLKSKILAELVKRKGKNAKQRLDLLSDDFHHPIIGRTFSKRFYYPDPKERDKGVSVRVVYDPFTITYWWSSKRRTDYLRRKENRK